MATWHQARRGPVQRHATQWSIVDDPPGNPSGVYLETSLKRAQERLAIWRTNGRDTQFCFILPPKGTCAMN